MEATYQIYNEDCIQGMVDRVADNSVHLTVTSIPFEELFTYSGKPEDVGNNGSTVDIRAGRFSLNMRFCVDQLLRVTAPGCNVCIHIQQLLAYKNQHGYMGRRDFRGAMVEVFTAGGFRFIGDTAIPKDPQQMAQRLNLHSLQFKTGHSRSSTDWAPAPNDYVLIFQKPGKVEVPVRPLVYPSKFGKDGMGLKGPKSRESFYEKLGRVDTGEYTRYLHEWADKHEAINPRGWMSPEDWICWAKGTWTEILQVDLLDNWKGARESEEEKHVCPLQLELIWRLVMFYSNPISVQPNVCVLDPFMGIGSTAYVCLGGPTHAGHTVWGPRNVIGFELKESYYRQCGRNCTLAKRRANKRERQERPLLAV